MKVLNKRNFKKFPENSVYIGRPSKWGNPYMIGRDGTRKEVIELYTNYILNSPLLQELSELKGKDLICWCAPQACHGDILKRLVEALE